MTPAVTILIPTLNAGPRLSTVLDAVMAQEVEFPFEVLAIDSGSMDGTTGLLRARSLRLIEIPGREFNHGLTRALGVREARGDIVVNLVQDAVPADSAWLRWLVDPFHDPQVAGAYGRQIALPDASPFVGDRLGHWAASRSEPGLQKLRDAAELEALAPLERLGRSAFDNVCSAVRRTVALQRPFRNRSFGEDLDWARRVLLAGHAIAFEPRACVIHSHDRSTLYELRRVTLDHANLYDLFGVHTVPTASAVMRCSVAAVAHLWNVVDRDERLGAAARWWWKLRAVPYGFTQNLAQYLGARSARADGTFGHRFARAFRRWSARTV
jgi:glycosyltransferase involved in cell wall biosynthesis